MLYEVITSGFLSSRLGSPDLQQGLGHLRRGIGDADAALAQEGLFAGGVPFAA